MFRTSVIVATVTIALNLMSYLASSPASAFSYGDFSDPTGLTFAGSSSTASNSLDLNAPFGAGAVWRTQKQVVDQGFETTFTFSVNPGVSTFAADGLGFVIQSVAVDGTTHGGSPGTPLTTNNVGVYLDTFLNTNISPVDSSNWHFDVISYDAAGNRTDPVSNNDIAGGKNTNQHEIRVVYDAGSTNLQVFYDSLQYVSISYDLSNEINLDNGTAWVGFTGFGNSDETHTIDSWNFVLVPEPSSAILLSLGLTLLGVRRRRTD